LRHYPIFLDLRGKSVLVAGAGKVALRKTRGLAAAAAVITVVAPDVLPEFAALPVEIVPRPFEAADVKGRTLVFAATNSRAVNAAIAAECRRQGIWVNVADRREECTFFVPARAAVEGAEIAISTGGRDPAMAAALGRRIRAFLQSGRVESE
jgi:siroheme synthase-like protein